MYISTLGELYTTVEYEALLDQLSLRTRLQLVNFSQRLRNYRAEFTFGTLPAGVP